MEGLSQSPKTNFLIPTKQLLACLAKRIGRDSFKYYFLFGILVYIPLKKGPVNSLNLGQYTLETILLPTPHQPYMDLLLNFYIALQAFSKSHKGRYKSGTARRPHKTRADRVGSNLLELPEELARDDSSSWAKHCGSWAVAFEGPQLPRGKEASVAKSGAH